MSGVGEQFRVVVDTEGRTHFSGPVQYAQQVTETGTSGDPPDWNTTLRQESNLTEAFGAAGVVLGLMAVGVFIASQRR